MPKFNPKRKSRSQQPATPPPRSPEKKSDNYNRGSPKLTKFYGIIIIAAIATGMIFLFNFIDWNLPPKIVQWDHVQLHIKIWNISDNEYDKNLPDQDTTKWYNFTTIYELSSDTNATIDVKEGLPIGIFNVVKEHGVGFESGYFPIMNCTDVDHDQLDDTTKEPANGWGFPTDHPFYNKIILVKFWILAHNPHS